MYTVLYCGRRYVYLPLWLAAGSDTLFTGLEDFPPKLSVVKTFRQLRYGRGPVQVLSAPCNWHNPMFVQPVGTAVYQSAEHSPVCRCEQSCDMVTAPQTGLNWHGGENKVKQSVYTQLIFSFRGKATCVTYFGKSGHFTCYFSCI
jgi:hypothetical protein